MPAQGDAGLTSLASAVSLTWEIGGIELFETTAIFSSSLRNIISLFSLFYLILLVYWCCVLICWHSRLVWYHRGWSLIFWGSLLQWGIAVALSMAERWRAGWQTFYLANNQKLERILISSLCYLKVRGVCLLGTSHSVKRKLFSELQPCVAAPCCLCFTLGIF